MSLKRQETTPAVRSFKETERRLAILQNRIKQVGEIDFTKTELQLKEMQEEIDKVNKSVARILKLISYKDGDEYADVLLDYSGCPSGFTVVSASLENFIIAVQNTTTKEVRIYHTTADYTEIQWNEPYLSIPASVSGIGDYTLVSSQLASIDASSWTVLWLHANNGQNEKIIRIKIDLLAFSVVDTPISGTFTFNTVSTTDRKLIMKPVPKLLDKVGFVIAGSESNQYSSYDATVWFNIIGLNSNNVMTKLATRKFGRNLGMSTIGRSSNTTLGFTPDGKYVWFLCFYVNDSRWGYGLYSLTGNTLTTIKENEFAVTVNAPLVFPLDNTYFTDGSNIYNISDLTTVVATATISYLSYSTLRDMIISQKYILATNRSTGNYIIYKYDKDNQTVTTVSEDSYSDDRVIGTQGYTGLAKISPNLKGYTKY